MGQPKPKASDDTFKAIKLYRGVSIYRVPQSRNWYVRVWDRERKRYVVKATGESSSIRARQAAQDLAPYSPDNSPICGASGAIQLR